MSAHVIGDGILFALVIAFTVVNFLQDRYVERLRDAIRRVVTGDGAQLENLDMADDEWDYLASGDRENFEVTMHIDAWKELARIARYDR